MNKFRTIAIAAAAITSISAAAFAQTPNNTNTAPHKPGFMQRLRSHFGGNRPGTMTNSAPGAANHRMMRSSPMAMSGSIIADKNTKVYHMPGDRGALPAEKNRVYFQSEAQAQAAGFRRAGTPHGGSMTARGHRASSRTAHPAPMNGANH